MADIGAVCVAVLPDGEGQRAPRVSAGRCRAGVLRHQPQGARKFLRHSDDHRGEQPAHVEGMAIYGDDLRQIPGSAHQGNARRDRADDLAPDEENDRNVLGCRPIAS